MHIGVIGAGWMGQAVASALSKGGHEVMLSSRHPDALAGAAADMGAQVGTIEEAAFFGEGILLTPPYRALAALAETLRDAVAGKIILDAANSYRPDDGELIRSVEKEGVALHTARLFPTARVVRCFSAVDATAVEASTQGRGERLGVPVAGDDHDAVAVAVQLVRDAGCDPLVTGDLASARSFQRHGPGFRANTSLTELRRKTRLPEV